MGRIRHGKINHYQEGSILMKMLQTGFLLGSLAFGPAMAADYSVGIVNAGTGFEGAGTALNLYSITNKRVDLVQGSPYMLPAVVGGGPYEPILVSIAPEHDLVYVVYFHWCCGTPVIVQFQITPKGLVYQWEQRLDTGDAGLQGSSINAVSNYLIERTYPGEGLWVRIHDRSGQEVVDDVGTDGMNLISGHIDPEGKFYYSCRNLSATYPGEAPANAVAVYKLDRSVTLDSTPFLTSTDPVFVQSECN
jgi:hypothetical protein